MTTIKDVYNALVKMDSDLAQRWAANDLIKAKLARSYDDWLEDHPGDDVTLEGHIDYYLDNAYTFYEILGIPDYTL